MRYFGDLGRAKRHQVGAERVSWSALGASWKGLGRLLGRFYRHLWGVLELFGSLGSVFDTIRRNIEKP